MGNGPSLIPATLKLADGRAVSLDLMLDIGYNDQLQLATGGPHKIAVPRPALPVNRALTRYGD